jgi:Protein of unknown function (DUF664)
VFGLYRDEIARANAIIAATPPGALARRRDPRWDAWGWPEPEQTVNLRWIILHMIEETARTPGTSTPRGGFSTAAPAGAGQQATGAESPGVTCSHHGTIMRCSNRKICAPSHPRRPPGTSHGNRQVVRRA